MTQPGTEAVSKEETMDKADKYDHEGYMLDENGERVLLHGHRIRKNIPVFCKDCKHIRRYELEGETILGDQCMVNPVVSLDPIRGEQRQYAECRRRNSNKMCQLFEPVPPPEPKRPWWRRWFRTDRERLFDATREVMRQGMIERARTLPIIPAQSTDSGPRTQGE